MHTCTVKAGTERALEYTASWLGVSWRLDYAAWTDSRNQQLFWDTCERYHKVPHDSERLRVTIGSQLDLRRAGRVIHARGSPAITIHIHKQRIGKGESGYTALSQITVREVG